MPNLTAYLWRVQVLLTTILLVAIRLDGLAASWISNQGYADLIGATMRPATDGFRLVRASSRLHEASDRGSDNARLGITWIELRLGHTAEADRSTRLIQERGRADIANWEVAESWMGLGQYGKALSALCRIRLPAQVVRWDVLAISETVPLNRLLNYAVAHCSGTAHLDLWEAEYYRDWFRNGMPNEFAPRVVDVLEALVSQGLAAPEDYALLGSATLKAGDLESARHWHELALSMRPSYLPSHLDLALIARQQGNSAEALTEADYLVAHHSNNKQAIDAAGITYWLFGQREAAIMWAKYALTLDSNDAVAHDLLGMALQNEDPATAEFHFSRAIELMPESYSYLTHFALFLSQRNPPKAITMFRQALAYAPTDDARRWVVERLHVLGVEVK